MLDNIPQAHHVTLAALICSQLGKRDDNWGLYAFGSLHAGTLAQIFDLLGINSEQQALAETKASLLGKRDFVIVNKKETK